jgi:hypothetical protein
MAYLILYPGQEKWNGKWRTAETLLNYFLILFGLYMLVAGTYVRRKTYPPTIVINAEP